jgi:hypothetical protein
MREKINSYNISVGKSQGKRQLEIPTNIREGRIKINLNGLHYKDTDFIQLIRNKAQSLILVNTKPSASIKFKEFLDKLIDYICLLMIVLN